MKFIVITSLFLSTLFYVACCGKKDCDSALTFQLSKIDFVGFENRDLDSFMLISYTPKFDKTLDTVFFLKGDIQAQSLYMQAPLSVNREYRLIIRNSYEYLISGISTKEHLCNNCWIKQSDSYPALSSYSVNGTYKDERSLIIRKDD